MSVNHTTTPLSEFLFIDKPIGPTSHDAVETIRSMLGGHRAGIKVGHAGTLDPLASGLLILGLGAATKLLGRLVGLDKTYEVEITLGATSTTDDAEGPIEPSAVILKPPIAEVEQVLRKFIGEQKQIPPAFSAKKQGGQRLYKIARRGGNVNIKPHYITIYKIKLSQYKYPKLRLIIHCSSGTYVRALARDIGQALGTGGDVSRLRRIAIGPFTVAEALPVSIDQDTLRAALRNPDIILSTTQEWIKKEARS
ncbi:tRNA pseudouridine(55) synthase TruB [Candidatus Uhrbacteria bacterium RIFCSPLOWO2_12_FULL_46_10]|nr:MAG: tRNA pseudouridine(55) synthase TruB [Candidatus Uhrbacteria bacterium RIFCSPLOWO2_12_FULL_46_10]